MSISAMDVQPIEAQGPPQLNPTAPGFVFPATARWIDAKSGEATRQHFGHIEREPPPPYTTYKRYLPGAPASRRCYKGTLELTKASRTFACVATTPTYLRDSELDTDKTVQDWAGYHMLDGTEWMLVWFPLMNNLMMNPDMQSIHKRIDTPQGLEAYYYRQNELCTGYKSWQKPKGPFADFIGYGWQGISPPLDVIAFYNSDDRAAAVEWAVGEMKKGVNPFSDEEIRGLRIFTAVCSSIWCKPGAIPESWQAHPPIVWWPVAEKSAAAAPVAAQPAAARPASARPAKDLTRAGDKSQDKRKGEGSSGQEKHTDDRRISHRRRQQRPREAH